ncbi:peptide ABC transporter substrate-binding protein [Methylobacterium persicinum]|uniref:Oligopeptide transport system substrate-binding protein n=1 Tax=Methylobacterium persicinum TaxID=374426 RepID=A0ABU0HK77_9HYPH|nr:peptide ABC transporter substrate-binding protein [Methylobacterium persicinum]MDQ0441941.1 oligopeptide transport system substrate-binding protein [Methylobacterium persicinum]GJE38958.1 Periplasmic oligopeptide-binding protein [Methylobacterium persicinum]
MRLRRRDWLAGSTALALYGPAAAAADTLYRRGNDADPETLDPHKSSTVAEAHLLRDLCDGLLTYDNRGAIVSGAAKDWSASADGMTYRFTLRPDGRWSNGDAVTADDFVFSLRRIMDPATGAKYAEVLYPIAGAAAVNRGERPVVNLGVAALDPATVEIRLEQPTPYFLELLTHQTAAPVHAASIARYGEAFTRPGNLVTNGPYRLVDRVPGDRILLEVNPHHPDAGSVAISRIAYVPTPDLSGAVRRYAAGEIDSLSDLPGDQMDTLRARFGTQVVLGPALGLAALALNTRKRPFTDVRVRRALSLVIDREYLAEAIFGGTMSPAYSLCPDGLDHYRTPPEIEGRKGLPIDHEEEARGLLAAAGYDPKTNPLHVEYRFNMSDNNRNTAVALAEMWRDLGVVTRFVYTDAKTHFAYLRDGGDFDIARMSWVADYSDPQNFLFLLQTGNDGFNAGHWSDAEYDRLLAEAAREMDLTRRANLLYAAEAIALRELPWIPLMHYRTKALIAPRLRGYHPNLRNAAPTRYLSLVA